ncbi:MAG: transglutaminase-like domain-containing protein [Armatimonadota bacterium]|nr:transglutaminase-like domain-containing protein [Armatimonadota bacterium]
MAKSQKVFFRKALGLWFALSLVMAFLAQHQWLAQRAYLQGFAEAIAPLDGSPSEKVDALLRYFRHHPPRLKTDPNDWDRESVTALRSSELLKICGSASAAFVFLARSLGIPARVLLLLNERGVTKHVTAEVWLDGRWVVVDPAFGMAMKDKGGRWLSKEELKNPESLRSATRNIPYPYTFDRTAYINWRKLPLVGERIGRWLRRHGLEERLGRPLWLDSPDLAHFYFWLGLSCLSGGLFLRQYIRRREKGA